MVFHVSSPEDNVIIKVVAGTNAGDCALRSETGFDEGPRVEHTQQGVDENLQQEKKQLSIHSTINIQYDHHKSQSNLTDSLGYLFALR